MSANTAPAAPPEASEPAEIIPTGLTPQQKSQWQDTMSLMAWTAPGFRHLFYKLLANNNGEYGAVPSKDVPIAATDAKNIIINPDTFFNYPLKQRVFAIGHEVVHNVYGDVEFLHRCQHAGTVPMNDGSTLPFRNSTMQKAMDFRINALLKESKIGEIIPNTFCDDEIAKANDGVCDVYKKVWEDEEDNGGKKVGGVGFDMVLQPGISTGKVVPNPRNPQQWAVEVQAAQTLEAMKAQGRGAGALSEFFDSILNPTVPWTDLIRGIFNRKVGSGSFNWKKPDRRMIVQDIYMPSRSGNGAGWVVCWGDSSGSIGNKELCAYLGELSGIIDDCQPQRLTVIWCDAAIQRIDDYLEAGDLETIRGAGAPGRGGTDVDPVFEWIAEHTDIPEVFIGFTDGYVTFPTQAPPIPTIIWAMTTDVEAPFGDTVHINP